jgi:hypothetical protein
VQPAMPSQPSARTSEAVAQALDEARRAAAVLEADVGGRSAYARPADSYARSADARSADSRSADADRNDAPARLTNPRAGLGYEEESYRQEAEGAEAAGSGSSLHWEAGAVISAPPTGSPSASSGFPGSGISPLPPLAATTKRRRRFKGTRSMHK